MRAYDFRGSWWQPAPWTTCFECHAKLVYRLSCPVDEEELRLLVQADKEKLNACKREPWYELSEYWIQIYFRENAQAYGFTVVDPNRPTGPRLLGGEGAIRMVP